MSAYQRKLTPREPALEAANASKLLAIRERALAALDAAEKTGSEDEVNDARHLIQDVQRRLRHMGRDE